MPDLNKQPLSPESKPIEPNINSSTKIPETKVPETPAAQMPEKPVDLGKMPEQPTTTKANINPEQPQNPQTSTISTEPAKIEPSNVAPQPTIQEPEKPKQSWWEKILGIKPKTEEPAKMSEDAARGVIETKAEDPNKLKELENKVPAKSPEDIKKDEMQNLNNSPEKTQNPDIQPK